MKQLFKNGWIVNVFTGQLERADVLICNGTILGTDQYEDADADCICDIREKYYAPA